jgi:hypothetical protein
MKKPNERRNEDEFMCCCHILQPDFKDLIISDIDFSLLFGLGLQTRFSTGSGL